MQEFLEASRQYTIKIIECLKNNEWLLDSTFQVPLIKDVSALDLMELPQVSFNLRQELDLIDVQGQLAQPRCKTVVLGLLSHGDDTSMLLGVLLYMYMTLRSSWSKGNESVVLRLQLLMAMLVKPEDLGAPIGTIGVLA